jgi:molybdopterin-guanine dinucleotide biosynthesis protein A
MSRPRRFSEVSGFVLAGGASRRMGLDKATLPMGSERLVDRQIRLLRGICRSVSIIGPRNRYADIGIPVYEDDIPGRGPLGGIYTGLRRARTEFSLFLSCDMPFLGTRFLRYLCQQALARRAPVTLPPPWTKGHYPLCAILGRSALPAVRSSLASGQNRVGRFFAKEQCRTISKAEFAHAGFSSRIFCNLNTREEYETARQQLVGD